MRGLNRDTAMAQKLYEPDLDRKREGTYVAPPDPEAITSERDAPKDRTEPENMIEQGEMFS